MNKNFAVKLRGLEADLAALEAKINYHLENKTNAQRELARLKFTEVTSSTWAKCGGQFPSHGFNI
jgi:hypothetical protein